MTLPVRVLMVSNDPSVFQEGSATRARLREYALHVETLHVLSRGSAKTIIDGNLVLHGAGSSRWCAKLFLAKKAARIAREERISVISAQDPFEHGRAALRACRRTGARLHVQIHTDFLSPYFAEESYINRLRVRIADMVLPEAQGIRVVSGRIQASLVARYGSRIVTPVVLPIAVAQKDESAVPLPETLPPFKLIAVSRLTKEKRIFDVLEAVARARKRYAFIGLAIVGSGPLKSALQKRAQRLGIASAVSFLGERSDVSGLMKSATAFIQASAYEGYGRTLIEAAHAHIPIITTDVGIVGEVLVPQESALVAPVGDVAALAAHVERLAGDNALRTMLAMSAERAVTIHQNALTDISLHIMRHVASVASVDI